MDEPFYFSISKRLPQSGSGLGKEGKRHGRSGIIHTPHGDIRTPAFIPVATQAAIKGVLPEKMEELGAQVLLSNAFHLHERRGIQNPDHLIAQNIIGGADIHELSRRRIDLLDLEVFVQNDQSVGGVVYNGIREAFRLVFQKRQTHGDLGFALADRNGFFPAGIISARAAVQFLRGLELAHLTKNVLDLQIGRHL